MSYSTVEYISCSVHVLIADWHLLPDGVTGSALQTHPGACDGAGAGGAAGGARPAVVCGLADGAVEQHVCSDCSLTVTVTATVTLTVTVNVNVDVSCCDCHCDVTVTVTVTLRCGRTARTNFSTSLSPPFFARVVQLRP